MGRPVRLVICSRQRLASAWQGGLGAGEQLERSSVRRLRKAEFAAAPQARFADETRFYSEIEQDYFDEMTGYLRDEIGVKQIILGSSDHNQGLNSPFHLENLAWHLATALRADIATRATGSVTIGVCC